MARREEQILEQLVSRGIGTSKLAGRKIQQEGLPTLRQVLGTAQATRAELEQQRIAQVRGQAFQQQGKSIKEMFGGNARTEFLNLISQFENTQGKFNPTGALDPAIKQRNERLNLLAIQLGIKLPRGVFGTRQLGLQLLAGAGKPGTGGLRGLQRPRTVRRSFAPLREKPLRQRLTGRGRQPSQVQLESLALTETQSLLKQLLQTQSGVV